MNCVTDDRSTCTDEPLSTTEASTFLSTIQNLPSADYREEDTNHDLTRNGSSVYEMKSFVEEDEIPLNLCHQAWGHDMSGKACENDFTCAVEIEDDTSINDLRQEVLARGKQDLLLDQQLSRSSSYKTSLSIITEKDCFELGRDRSNEMKAHVANSTGGVLSKLAKMSPLRKNKKEDGVKLMKEVEAAASYDTECIVSPNNVMEDISLGSSKVANKSVSASSNGVADKAMSDWNSSSKADMAEGNMKKRLPFKFMRNSKNKRLVGAAAATVPMIAMGSTSSESKGKYRKSTITEAESSPEHVHLMALKPEETPIKYDEICYGSTASYSTPAPVAPVDLDTMENSILKAADETASPMTCDISPVKSEQVLKTAVTAESVELDATLPTVSTTFDNANGLDKSNTVLADVSRTLFPDDEKTMAVGDITFNGLGDEDVFECRLEKDEPGLMNVAVEGSKVEEAFVAKAKDEMQDTDTTHSLASEDKPKKEPRSSVFSIDLFSFTHFFSCGGSSSDPTEKCDSYEKEHESNDISLSNDKTYFDAIKDAGNLENGSTFDSSFNGSEPIIQPSNTEEEKGAKMGWVKNIRSRSSGLLRSRTSSLSIMSKPSFGVFSGNMRCPNNAIKLEIVDDDVEVTLPN
eukprot:scaffold53302_cov69-Cyclotella_meneghiniana.AAC.4